ncbi:MAG: Stk1 family PASTA domain-containing Ser/Thr kinase [Clostridia bacterium]|nr:Stk1 family PASTA domain-containing Ser/Thr kinase [Clostridia bacterium]
MIGKIFNNRYELLEKIGSGGTAIVYKGYDKRLNRMVTVKILRDEYNNESAFVHRFEHEAQAIASLSHGNIVNVYDFGSEDKLHYIVIEFVEGETLKNYINRKGALPVAEAASIMYQILDALGYAHSNGIIHRDVKPQNILFAKDGRVKVADFGIAAGPNDLTQTYDNNARIMGSVHYISPEQVQGYNVTEKSDIYSAGVVFYEMLTGQLPFTGDTPISVAMKHVQNELNPPHRVNPKVPVGLSYVIMRAMRKSPDIRYATAQEMADSIRSVVEGMPNQPAPIAPTEKEINNEDTRELVDINAKEVRKRRVEERIDERMKGLPSTANPRVVQKKLNKKNVSILAGIIMLLALAVIGIKLIDTVLETPDISVPSVVGLPLEEAKETLKSYDLAYLVIEDYSADVPEGNIMEQDIAEGMMVKKGREVKITVSLGIKLTRVPNVVGYTKEAAGDELRNNKFVVVFEEVYDTQADQGTVIRQNPVGGSQAAEKSTVTVTVSSGAQPAEITMISLKGKTLAEAKTVLTDMLLAVGKVDYAESNDYAQGKVIGQSVAAGQNVDEGTAINLTLSQGPGPVAKLASVSYAVPDDGLEHTVRIVVEDAQGSREAYSAKAASGTYISKEITFYNSGKIKVYLDGELVDEATVS